MKNWRNLAIDLLKEEQARQEYRENNFTVSNNGTSTSSTTIIDSHLFNKLKRQYNRYYRFKTKSTQHEYLNNVFIQSEFDKDTMDFIMETPRWNFVSNTFNWLLSWVYTKTDIMGYIGMGKMFILSTDQYMKILRVPEERYDVTLPEPFDSLLDIGSGCGTTTLLMKPLFANVTATEASKGMIYSLNKKGIDSVFCLDLEQCDQLRDKQYDVVSCLNVLDRCEKPISLLNTIKKFLKPNTGKLILAVVFPFKPYVEFGGIDNKPLENIELTQDTLADYVDSFNKVVFIPNGYEIDSFTLGPYISEGDGLYQNYVLTDVVFVLTQKRGASISEINEKNENGLMSCD